MATTTIKEVTDYLESLAPRAYQENYDNSGLLTGYASSKITGVLVTLDCLESVVEEAIRTNCNLIVAHHPILFKGVKKLTGENYVERTIIKAIKNDIAIYAIHTNLDNVHQGVNKRIGEKIGLKNMRVLVPNHTSLLKLTTFIPAGNKEEIMTSLHQAGAGNIGDYKHCSFQVMGEGSFLPTGKAIPSVGQLGKMERVHELRVEMILPEILKNKVLAALKKAHPYEEVAYYLTRLENENQEVGAGMIGELEHPMDLMGFLLHVKKCMNAPGIRYTASTKKPINTVAWCGGAGSFLLSKAIAAGADLYLSSDFKYHEFFDADNKLVIADIGHYESEQYTKDLLTEVLKEKFTTFATTFSKTFTNPISYL